VDNNFQRFWKSFEAWFLKELPFNQLLKSNYTHYDNWDGGTYYVDIDYTHLYKLIYGIEWVDIFKEDAVVSKENFKFFIEAIYEECIKERYKFTIAVNERLGKFNLPYRLEMGKFVIDNTLVGDQTKRIATIVNTGYINTQIKIMNDSIADSPADAIGKAKELFENCCKTILSELSAGYDENWDVIRLTKETCKVLKLTPDHIKDSVKGSESIKKLLGNLAAVSQSMAELRNLYGSGHGKEAKFKGLSPRHARLAVGGAAAAVLFIWETYEEQKGAELWITK